jgi:hypothetical protein
MYVRLIELSKHFPRNVYVRLIELSMNINYTLNMYLLKNMLIIADEILICRLQWMENPKKICLPQ